MSIDDKIALKEWRESHPDEHEQSKRKLIDSRKGGNNQRKRQIGNKHDGNIRAQIQSVACKLLNAKLNNLDGDSTNKVIKKVKFKVSEANAEAWIEELINKIAEKDGSVGTLTVAKLMKEVHTVPQGIKVTISDKKTLESQKN